MRTVAVFMDAGYFWAQVHKIVIGERTNRNDIAIDYPKLREALLGLVEKNFRTSELLRVYWYDGPGANDTTSEHRSIQELDDFKLRLGTRNSIGQQKGVDGLIIADIISLTQTKAITDALLISGDADITPGVVAAQSLGLRVHQLSIGGLISTSPFLLAEVDRGYAWEEAEILAFAQAKNKSAKSQKNGTSKDSNGEKEATTTKTSIKTAHANFDEIAGEYLNSNQSLKEESFHEKAQLPRDIDAGLLSLGRKKIGRSLQEDEKRGLRTALKKLLKS